MRAAGLLPYTSFSTPVSCGNGIHVKRPLRAVSSFGWSSFHMPRFPQTGDGIWWAVEGDGGVPGGRPHATPLAAATDRPTDPAGAGPPLGHGRGRPPPPAPFVCLGRRPDDPPSLSPTGEQHGGCVPMDAPLTARPARLRLPRGQKFRAPRSFRPTPPLALGWNLCRVRVVGRPPLVPERWKVSVLPVAKV